MSAAKSSLSGPPAPWGNNGPPAPWGNNGPPAPWGNNGPPAPWGNNGPPAPAGRKEAPDPPAAAEPGSDPRRPDPASHRRLLSPGHTMTITAMVTTLALLTTAGVAAWQVGELHARMHAAMTSILHSMGQSQSSATQPARTSPPSQAASSPVATQPAGGTLAVAVAPAAAQVPHVQPVVTLLSNYFTAINRHDFQGYVSLFIPAIRASMQRFGRGYASTVDSDATLTGLVATGPQGLAATVTFTSHQHPADSPDHAACDRWDITVFVKHNGNGYRIRRPRPGFPDSVRSCA